MHAVVVIMLLFLSSTLISLTVAAPTVPPDHELRQHFPSISTSEFAEMTSLLDQIKAAARNKFYGKDQVLLEGNDEPIVVASALHHSTDNLPSVSISIAQPGVQLPISRYLFEGDILLSPRQANNILRNLLRVLRKSRKKRRSGSMISRQKRLNQREKRNLDSEDSARWMHFPVQYIFHESLRADAIAEIEKAVAFWMNNTCLAFERVTEPGRDYIEFFRGQGCYSMIGRVGGRQGVSIGEGCERMGTIEHEIGHALGLWHEQSRPDAEQHILLATENIISAFISDFLQRSWDEVATFGVPYDLGSVMHYGSTAFTNDWSKKTVLTRDDRFQRTIGQRERLSFYDIQVINKAYCTTRCNVQLPCQNGGYTHPGNCDICICPDGLGGRLCDQNEPSLNATCGGVLLASDQWTEIISPGYPDPGYNIDQKCSWILRAPASQRVELQFIDRFQFFCTTTCLDFVEVKASADFRNTGFRYCCFERPEANVISESNDMIVIFRSSVSRDVGFRAKFRSTNAPATEAKLLPLNSTSELTTITTTTTTTTEDFSTSARPQFSPWGAWSDCSRSCGGCGIQSRARTCLLQPCEGSEQQFQHCNFQTCPAEHTCTRINFVDEVCDSFGREICSRAVQATFQCHVPYCCPPFLSVNGLCKNATDTTAAESATETIPWTIIRTSVR